MKKRIWSFLLCMALLIGVMPMGLFTLTANAADKLYKTENAEVPDGWDYIEVSTAEDLTSAMDKHSWWENDCHPQSVFIRLMSDITVSDENVSKNSHTLIYAALSNSTTVDFNGHKINGKIRAINNQDNKTWSTLSIRLWYGCVPDFTLRFVDSVGGGGVTLDAETFIDGPTNAVSVFADCIQDSSPAITDDECRFKKEGATFIIDGGSYKLNTKNKKFTNTQFSDFKTFRDSAGKPCWDSRTPYTRSAVGVNDCKTVINNGHFTAINYIDKDNVGTKMGNRFVSAFGMNGSYATNNLRINGGDFDGSAYALFSNCASGIPVLNGGTYQGGIMLCSDGNAFWNKTMDTWNLDNDAKKRKLSAIVPEGALFYIDDHRADLTKKTLEDIALPHSVSIYPAPEITECKATNTELFTGEIARVSYRFNQAPDSITVQEYITTIRNGKETSIWKDMEEADYHIFSGNYVVEIPARDKADTATVRIKAEYEALGYTLVSDSIKFEWFEETDFEDYQITKQPESQTVAVGSGARIEYDYNFKDKLKSRFLYWLEDGDHWTICEKCDSSVMSAESQYFEIEGPDKPGAKKITYQIVLEFRTDTSKTVTVYSNEFTITWDDTQYIGSVKFADTLLAGTTLDNALGDPQPATSALSAQLWYHNGEIAESTETVTTGKYAGLIRLEAKDGYAFSTGVNAGIFGQTVPADSVSSDGKTAYFTIPTVTVTCTHMDDTSTYSSNEQYHWHVCSVCGMTYGNAVHDYKAVGTVGSKTTYECKQCGYQKVVNNGKEAIDYVLVSTADTPFLAIGDTLPEVDLGDYYNSKITLSQALWTEGTSRDTAVTVAPGATVKDGMNYYLAVSCYAKDGYYFGETPSVRICNTYASAENKYVSSDGNNLNALIEITPQIKTTADIVLPQMAVGKTFGEVLDEIKTSSLSEKGVLCEIDAEFEIGGVEFWFYLMPDYGNVWKATSYHCPVTYDAFKNMTVQPGTEYKLNLKLSLSYGTYYVAKNDVTVENGYLADSFAVTADNNVCVSVKAIFTTEGDGKSIGFVNLKTAAPKPGDTPASSIEPMGGAYAEKVEWTGAMKDGKFACDTAYTVKITLCHDIGFEFTDSLIVTLNGNIANVVKSGDKRIVTYTFAKIGHDCCVLKYDEHNHWTECSAPNCTEKKSAAPHSMVNHSCTVCGYSDLACTLSGKVTSFGSASDKITISLYKTGQSTPAYTTQVTGNSANYTLSNVAAGTYTMTVSKTKHATREYTITVSSDTTQNAELHLYGDVNGDGKVDSTDARLILQYYAKKIGESDLNTAAADVNADGKVDSTDARLILQLYAKKISEFPVA